MTKSQIRQQLIARRAKLSDDYRIQANQNILEHITTSTVWQQSESVAIYLAFGHEADISELLHSEKKIYLPSIKGEVMQFQLFNNQTMFETLSYGLKQPKFIPDMTVTEIQLYLMPLLGFDLSGTRLGMGGGFYDRYFANQRTAATRAGVAYQCQQYERLPCDPWDVKIEHIFTEQNSLTL